MQGPLSNLKYPIGEAIEINCFSHSQWLVRTRAAVLMGIGTAFSSHVHHRGVTTFEATEAVQ